MAQQRIPEFYQGYNDWLDGKLVNPHRPNTIKAKEWQHGQDCAYIDQQKKLGAYVRPPRVRRKAPYSPQELRRMGFPAAAAHFEKHGFVLCNVSL